MAIFNSSLVDESVTQNCYHSSLFGLIGSDQAHRTELFGFEVTLTGEIVEPWLCPPSGAHCDETFSAPELE